MAQKRPRVRGEDARSSFSLRRVGFDLRLSRLQPFDLAQPFHALFVTLQNAGIEHRSGLSGADQTIELIGESREVLIEQADGQPRTGAELPYAKRDRILQSFGDCVRAFAQSSGQDEYRIDAAHLGVYRNRIGAAYGRIEQRASTAQATCETDRPRQRMFDQSDAYLASRAVKQREHARRHSRRLDSFGD